MFYSQHGEDYLLASLLGRETPGFFIDIGAFDGVHLSNSCHFEKAGWRGICVEASPQYYDLLARNRPGSVCVQAIVGASSGQIVEFYQDPTGLLSTVSWSAEAEEAARKACERRGIPFAEPVVSRIATSTLTEILDEHAVGVAEIDFLSVDVEGQEIDVLSGLDFGRFHPRVIVAESHDKTQSSTIGDLLSSRGGYRFARRVHVNDFFVRDEADVERLRSVRLDVMLPANPHPGGESLTHPDQRVDRVVIGGRSFFMEDLVQLGKDRRTLDALGIEPDGVTELKRERDTLKAQLETAHLKLEEVAALKRAADKLELDAGNLQALKRERDRLAAELERAAELKRCADRFGLDADGLVALKRERDRLAAELERVRSNKNAAEARLQELLNQRDG